MKIRTKETYLDGLESYKRIRLHNHHELINWLNSKNKIMSFFEGVLDEQVELFQGTSTSIFPLIKLSDKPTQGNWSYPPLYKYDINMKERLWTIKFDETESSLIVESGTLEGKQATNCAHVEPKVNRTLQQQAVQEARRRYEEKIRKGYATTLDRVDLTYKPMLSQDYDDREPAHISGNKSKISSTVMIQEKLDGQRIMVRILNNKLVFFSRGSVFYTHITHFPELIYMFTILGSKAMIDGEAIITGMPMEKIRGIISQGVNSKGKIVGKIHPDLSKLEYHIFDYKPMERLGVIERYNNLQTAYKYMKECMDTDAETKISIVPMELVSDFSKDDLYELMEKYVSKGYEGIMIKQTFLGAVGRNKDTVAEYQSGRRVNTFKLKPFDYDYAIVLSVLPSEKRSDICTFKMQDVEKKVTFGLKYGTREENIEWLKNPESMIGKKILYKHQGFTDKDGKPRFPTFKIDDEERKKIEARYA